MKKMILVLGVIIFTAFTNSYAQTGTPVVTKRQVNQQKRIVNGVKTGELTRREVVLLEKQQMQVNRLKKIAKADGVVTKKEKARIYTLQNRASTNVCLKKHNNISRN